VRYGLTLFERCHGKNTRENTLVVTVEQTTQTGETCNTETFKFLIKAVGPDAPSRALRRAIAAASNSADPPPTGAMLTIGMWCCGRSKRDVSCKTHSIFLNSTRSDDRSMQCQKRKSDPCKESKFQDNGQTQPLHICTPNSTGATDIAETI
jgi:hypothetical protein